MVSEVINRSMLEIFQLHWIVARHLLSFTDMLEVCGFLDEDDWDYPLGSILGVALQCKSTGGQRERLTELPSRIQLLSPSLLRTSSSLCSLALKCKNAHAGKRWLDKRCSDDLRNSPLFEHPV